MRKILVIIITFCITYSTVLAQVSPFNIPPKWYFGQRAGLDFTSGSPAFLPGGQTNGAGHEGNSNVCDPDGNIVFYTDNYRLYDASHSMIQLLRGATSSTQGSVSIPDPADPANRFYLFTANVDPGGGGERDATNTNMGIHYYHIQKSGAGITVLAGPVRIANHNEVTEQICAGTDYNGNYWIVSHEGGRYSGGMNRIYSWKVTSSGVGSRVTSSITGTTGNNAYLGSMKINKCQTKLGIAHFVGTGQGSVEVYNWDANSGMVTGLAQRIPSLPAMYGCEFSPDGNIFYYTALSDNRLYQLDLTTGTVYTDASWTSSNNMNEMGTLQLGPDDKIYVTNVSNFGLPCYIGVINNPNVVGAGCNYNKTGFLLNGSVAPNYYPNIFRGISNMAWMNPNLPSITNNNCPQVQFAFNFNNYFKNPVTVVPASIEWDFGDGGGYQSGLGASPTHEYTSTGNYTVNLRLRDQTCNVQWTTSANVNIGCTLPVTWLDINTIKEGNKIIIEWSTLSETDNNHFIIEKSEDGINFYPIAKLNSNKKSTTGSNYHYPDLNPTEGLNFYKIRQVDINGNNSESKTVFINYSEDNIHVFPNPSQSDFTIYFPNSGNVIFQIYDITGKKIVETEVTAQRETKIGSELSDGIYTLKTVTEGKVYTQKLVKNK
ncbi:MAG: T9SS type A sorting domain-containing protein [Cytophagaceae bacterium]